MTWMTTDRSQTGRTRTGEGQYCTTRDETLEIGRGREKSGLQEGLDGSGQAARLKSIGAEVGPSIVFADEKWINHFIASRKLRKGTGLQNLKGIA